MVLFSHRHAQDHHCSKLEDVQAGSGHSKTAEHVQNILGMFLIYIQFKNTFETATGKLKLFFDLKVCFCMYNVNIETAFQDCLISVEMSFSKYCFASSNSLNCLFFITLAGNITVAIKKAVI